jgi:Rod binding domain-containing protein
MPEAISLHVGAQPIEGKRPENLKLKDAAGKFEALLIQQMLKSARASDSGGWTGESDQAGSAILDLAEQHLAELLGSQGGLGLARMVVKQLG